MGLQGIVGELHMVGAIEPMGSLASDGQFQHQDISALFQIKFLQMTKQFQRAIESGPFLRNTPIQMAIRFVFLFKWTDKGSLNITGAHIVYTGNPKPMVAINGQCTWMMELIHQN